MNNSNFIKIAKRQNNTKRKFLIVNPLQGKHIPVSPSSSLEVFDSLAHTIDGKYAGEKILVIGFAETATAIGARVAINLGMPYIQTTRETIPDADYLFFSEEHSHATEQKLVKNDIDSIINSADRIIFVEDEVTTGKTILNIISIIQKTYSKKIQYSVMSILNGMSEENLIRYKECDIDLFYLQKIDNKNYDELADSFTEDGKYLTAEKTCREYKIKNISGYINARRLIFDSILYEESCKELGENIYSEIENSVSCKQNILVLGSEEFMYPAMRTAKVLEDHGKNVKFHATTRSPICVSSEENYPLHCRYELESLYDRDRTTFVYDIKSYDKVIIVTDAVLDKKSGIKTLLSAAEKNNTDIEIFRWC